jgi:putative peptide zinc metalloprotease protein
MVWPAFYTDVTDAYRLGKAGRLRTDLGGVYFNVVFVLLTAGAYAITGFEPLLLVIPLQHFEILHQFLPFLRLDGYYIVSDLTGVPDMFSRIKPTLTSLLPWKEADARVTELKPWVRAAVTVYVLTLVPALAFMFGLMLLNAPRIFATGYDSFFVQLHKVEHADALHAAVGAIQMAVLVLPSLGIVVTLARTGRRLGTAAWTRTEGHPAARGALALATAAAAAFLAYTWWPNGEYRPIQPDERGTLQGAVEQLAAVPGGRPSLTPERERQLGGARFRSDSSAPPSGGQRSRGSTSQPASTEPAATTATTAETDAATTAETETTGGETSTAEETATTETTTSATVTSSGGSASSTVEATVTTPATTATVETTTPEATP